MTRLLLVGVGNMMRRDDAIGLRVVHLLRSRLPPDVRVVESDGDLTRFCDALADAGTVVVVDAMVSGVAPGAVTRVSEDAMAQEAATRNLSTHAMGFAATIEMLKVLGVTPTIRVYGVQGVDFGWGEGLSGELEHRLETIAHEVYREIVTMLP
jgi:hydrogenase maturation protease